MHERAIIADKHGLTHYPRKGRAILVGPISEQSHALLPVLKEYVKEQMEAYQLIYAASEERGQQRFYQQVLYDLRNRLRSKGVMLRNELDVLFNEDRWESIGKYQKNLPEINALKELSPFYDITQASGTPSRYSREFAQTINADGYIEHLSPRLPFIVRPDGTWCQNRDIDPTLVHSAVFKGAVAAVLAEEYSGQVELFDDDRSVVAYISRIVPIQAHFSGDNREITRQRIEFYSRFPRQHPLPESVWDMRAKKEIKRESTLEKYAKGIRQDGFFDSPNV